MVHESVGAEAALGALRDGEVVPDLIVIAQTFPGQFSHHEVDQLRRLAPLSQIVGIMGSWCEGEMRTGAPWPGVVRTYWHQWAARSSQQLERLAKGKCCSWTLPSTTTEEERLLADQGLHGHCPHPDPLPKGEGTSSFFSGLVVISAQSREMAQWLTAACRGHGYATVWQRLPARPQVAGAAAAIFDGTDLGSEEYRELQRLVAAVHPAPVIVLLAFPRIEDRDRARSAGAAAVVSKPVNVDDLIWEVGGRVDSG
jgi:CheY-like chemotaxis protein